MDFRKILKHQFHTIPSSWSRVISNGRTDWQAGKHDEYK